MTTGCRLHSYLISQGRWYDNHCFACWWPRRTANHFLRQFCIWTVKIQSLASAIFYCAVTATHFSFSQYTQSSIHFRFCWCRCERSDRSNLVIQIHDDTFVDTIVYWRNFRKGNRSRLLLFWVYVRPELVIWVEFGCALDFLFEIPLLKPLLTKTIALYLSFGAVLQ